MYKDDFTNADADELKKRKKRIKVPGNNLDENFLFYFYIHSHVHKHVHSILL